MSSLSPIPSSKPSSHHFFIKAIVYLFIHAIIINISFIHADIIQFLHPSQYHFHHLCRRSFQESSLPTISKSPSSKPSVSIKPSTKPSLLPSSKPSSLPTTTPTQPKINHNAIAIDVIMTLLLMNTIDSIIPDSYTRYSL